MSRKLTSEQVKNLFDSKNLIYIETEYRDCMTKLAFKCPKHEDKEIQYIRYHDLRKCEFGCKYCAKDSEKSKKKLPYENIKHFIEVQSNSGCKLVSKEYKSSHDYIDIKCECGNIFTTTYSTFKDKNKRKCDVCSNCIQWNYELVKNFIENESSSGCKLISTDYVSYNKKLKLLCRCGKEFEARFSDFKNESKKKRQCNECGNNNAHSKRILPYLTIKQYIEGLEGNGCKLLTLEDEYTKSTDKLYIQCACGNTYNVTFTTFKKQKQCQECGEKNRIKKTSTPYEQIKIFIDGEEGNGCRLITQKEEYKNSKQKLKIQCHCGRVFDKSFSAFKNANERQCTPCSKQDVAKLYRLSYEDVKERFAKEGYTLLSEEYINNAQKLNIMCPDGHITQNDLSHFMEGKRCSVCNGGVAYTYEFVKNTIASEPGYKLISNTYINVFAPIEIQCSKGHIYETRFTNWQIGLRCTECEGSSGAIRVENYLIHNKYPHLLEFKFNDCKNIYPLSFDFAVFLDDEKTKLKLLIEYDGEYHYQPIESYEILQYTQNNDKIKNEYCKRNNIKLIRIPYWDLNNIKIILDKEFDNNEFKVGA